MASMGIKQSILGCILTGLSSIYPALSQLVTPTAGFPSSTLRLGVQLSTAGIGFQAEKQVSAQHRLSARLGVSYLAYRKTIQVAAGEGSSLTVYPDLVLGIAQASLKWHPLRQYPFYIAAGGGYTGRPSLGVTLLTKDKITFGGLEMKAEDLGIVNASVRWHHVLGYAALGVGRPVPRRRIGVNVELGCYYLGTPDVSLNYEGFLETTTIQEQLPKIRQNIAGYRYLPSLTIALTYVIPPL
ncbi:hypothetical protein GCM10023189_35180 [Nibrella saemangeumensis]|uniref:Outer membrane protein beta-barrel domain-containing protein n=1 Tax=Nibrella saemangeumensis TaxID=1084526 RepID=A0ABP8N2Q7_9BACT